MLPEVLTDISLDNSALAVIETPKFDAEQLKAVSLRTGKNLVTGLPGTGKTLVLAENVIQQINSGISSDKILIFCFSRDQVRTMRKYLSRRLFEKSIPQVSTFHSFTHAVMQSALNQGILSENYSLSPLRLLSGPEQEVIISELIKGSIEDKSIDWPQYLKPSLQTRGFVRQVRNLLARMRSLGMDPDQLIEVGQKYENNNWIALGHFAEMYLDNLDASESIDYGELIHRVNLLLHQVKDLKELNINYSHFYVDEYQDIDSSQVRLLKKLVSPNKFLFCAGDKSESIYQFRGADIQALDRFNEDFGLNEQVNLKYNYRTKVKIEPELLTFDSFNSQSNYIANEVSKFKYENISNKWSDVLIIIRNSNSLKNIQLSLITFVITVEVDAE
ncbi:MAG: UvrD-helicase domain-containing protein, partial [Actinomycetes bacterium]